MPVSATTLSKLMAAGLRGQELLDVVASIDADMVPTSSTKPKTAGAIRQERYRQRQASQNVTSNVTRDVTATLSPPSGSPPTPPSPNPLQSIPPSPPKGGSSPSDHIRAEFEKQFWPAYPNKVGKPDGLKAFVRARQRAGLDPIMVGLRRYIAKTDDRPWCNPSTWLNQDRWDDQPAAVARGQPPPAVGSDGLARDAMGRVSMADYTSQILKKMEDREHDGRTIEGSYERRNGDGAQQAIPFARTENRQS